MKDILAEIVEHKQVEVAMHKQLVPTESLEDTVSTLPPTGRSMKAALAASETGIIAEFKRKSPSKGWIHQNARPSEVIPAYWAGGAAALSILTDEHFFGGTLKDIKAVRPLIQLPILRKDFIIDEHQLYEARLTGADAVLLIAACLTVDRCCELASMAHAIGLEVLLEVHSEEELPYVCCHPDMLGVNNRNLGTFVTDVQNSFRMAEALKQTIGQAAEAPLLVSESGLSKPEVVLELREAGYRGFLMGEAFMKEILPGMALKRFTKALRS
ncbi:MAG: indole-3-glycerol phosphate synthase TrpC [Bacteroidaceae bacterium]|nr:indole-3-glycerol phosphate synthase TrpC [Bacteroidaceae bacterium]